MIVRAVCGPNYSSTPGAACNTLRQIISLEDVHVDASSDTLHIVMELMECDLQRVLASRQVLTVDHVKVLLKQLLLGVQAMHSHGIIRAYKCPRSLIRTYTRTLLMIVAAIVRPYVHPTSFLSIINFIFQLKSQERFSHSTTFWSSRLHRILMSRSFVVPCLCVLLRSRTRVCFGSIRAPVV